MMDCIAKNMKAASEAKQRHTVAGNGANRHAGRHDQISGHQHAAGTLFRAGESRQQDPTAAAAIHGWRSADQPAAE